MKAAKSDFQERFKGRTTQIDKDGHLGLVYRTNKPVKKEEFPTPAKLIPDFFEIKEESRNLGGKGSFKINHESTDFSSFKMKYHEKFSNAPANSLQSL